MFHTRSYDGDENSDTHKAENGTGVTTLNSDESDRRYIRRDKCDDDENAVEILRSEPGDGTSNGVQKTDILIPKERSPGEFISLHYSQTRVSTVSLRTSDDASSMSDKVSKSNFHRGGRVSDESAVPGLDPRLSSTSPPGSRYSKRRDYIPRRSSVLLSSQAHRHISDESDSDQEDSGIVDHSFSSVFPSTSSARSGSFGAAQRGNAGPSAKTIGHKMESLLKHILCCYLQQDTDPHTRPSRRKDRISRSRKQRNSLRKDITIRQKDIVDIDEEVELVIRSNNDEELVQDTALTREDSDGRPANASDIEQEQDTSIEPITAIHNLITQVQRQSNLGRYNPQQMFNTSSNGSDSRGLFLPRHTNRLQYHHNHHQAHENILIKKIPRNNGAAFDRRLHRRGAPSLHITHTTEEKYLLPPQPERLRGRKTLVLDLDETLVHSSFRPVFGADIIVDVEIDRMSHKVYVCKRPGVDQFLEAVSKHFEVVVFTASLSKYADPVMDLLDPKGYITDRLFRESCTFRGGSYIKDLRRLGRDLSQSVIIDNSPICFSLQPENGLACTSWFDDPGCRELLDMIPWLERMAQDADVYETIELYKQHVASRETPYHSR